MGREDEYFGNAKERQEEDTVDMYHSQDGQTDP